MKTVQSIFLYVFSMAVAVSFSSIATSVHGTELGQLATKMKPGEWRELKTKGYGKELLTSGRSGIIAYSESAAWDAKSKSLHFIGQGHLSPPPKYISYWAETNEWKSEPCPEWLAKLKWFHSYDNNSCDPVNGHFFHRPSASRVFWQYEIGEKKWSKLPDLPDDAPAGHGTATAFFPDLGVKGSLLTFHSGKAHRFDMGGKNWHPITGDFSKAALYHNVAEYNPKHKTVVFGGGNGSKHLYAIDLNGKVTTVKETPCNIRVSSSHLMICPTSGELLLLNFTKEEKGFWALNPTDANADWRKLADAPVSGGAVATIDSFGVILHLGYQQVMVYKHASADKEGRRE
ncbi:MAG: hypothetical protein VB875_08750 [Pirellulales bacterium]